MTPALKIAGENGTLLHGVDFPVPKIVNAELFYACLLLTNMFTVSDSNHMTYQDLR